MEKGIKFECEYDVKTVLPIDEVSMCRILGNALDNAIEAAQQLPPEREPRIDINMLYQDNRLTIRIANTSNPVDIENNMCKTTKLDKWIHGRGLRNIYQAVEDYGGNAVIKYENGMFVLRILFLM